LLSARPAPLSPFIFFAKENTLGELPLHLLLPLIASLLFTFGALFVKRATSSGISVWTVTFLTNIIATAAFSCFWSNEGSIPWSLIWQPALIAALYIGGQIAILSAVTHGDVSVAMPVASLKVVIVAAILSAIAVSSPSLTTWIAVLLSTIGVILIHNIAPRENRREILLTAILAMIAATTYAIFDVCVQFYSPLWGTRHLLPFIFWMVGLFSLVMIPFIDRPLSSLRDKAWISMSVGAFFIGTQALFIVFALSRFGDAARVNVVYSLRGFWGVMLAWSLARWFRGAEADLPRNTMVARLIGTLFLIAAVVITILSRD
jgi:drug/metabolite transporter (DMT)-like permease